MSRLWDDFHTSSVEGNAIEVRSNDVSEEHGIRLPPQHEHRVPGLSTLDQRASTPQSTSPSQFSQSWAWINSCMQMHFNHPYELLFACVRDDQISRLQSLLNTGAGNLEYQHPLWGTPLHAAIWCNNVRAIRVLLDAGADPLARIGTARHITAITLAARHGNNDVFELLCSRLRPTDDTHRRLQYETWIEEAASYGNASIVSNLLGWEDSWSAERMEPALWRAARRWQSPTVAILLERLSYSPEAVHKALTEAVYVKFKLREGESHSERDEGPDDLNQRLLMMSCIQGEHLQEQYLLHRTARTMNVEETLHLLLENVANPNMKDSIVLAILHHLAVLIVTRQINKAMNL
ncbi:ankyrin repeat-containing domain protein [Hypoxylon crocopeplum]|nr:ankyrin repeat-containing domain protein [Hypoxylon crocopeplum]